VLEHRISERSVPLPRIDPRLFGSSSVDALAQSIRNRRTILFVGAGVSRSVGLPSWQQLIDRMGQELGLDKETLDESGNSYQTLAEFYRISRGSIGSLRSWMDRTWRVNDEDVRCSLIHKLIIDLNFPIIYTTNYDGNLEAAFRAHSRAHVKIVNARDIAKTREGVTQIVKFHGDFEDDHSLVIGETDYFNRLTFDTPLDIKLRADALGKTILFIGYSMTDLNIRLLLHRLWQIWHRSGLEKDRPKSYVFMTTLNPVQEAVLGQWGVFTIAGAGQKDPAAALTDFMSDLMQRVSIGSDGGKVHTGRLSGGSKRSRRSKPR
jgi:hypothetical protein